MGKTMMGSATHEGNVSMLTPEQQQQYSQIVSALGPQFQQLLGNIMGGYSPEQMQDIFQKSYVDPAMQTFNQQVVPGIQQRFADAGASSSSALNQALAQSARDLSTSLGSNYGQFLQNQQQLQLGAAGMYSPLLGQQTFSPVINKQQGLAGPLIGAGGALGASALPLMFSSKTVKENIREYNKGIEEIESMQVKQYDYIAEVGGAKDKVGLIAEELPKELTALKDGIMHVDLYGLVSLLINAIKDLNGEVRDLNRRVEFVEEK